MPTKRNRNAGPKDYGAIVHNTVLSRPQFEGYKPGQNCRRIELANDAFDIAKTSRQRVHGNDIAVTG